MKQKLIESFVASPAGKTGYSLLPEEKMTPALKEAYQKATQQALEENVSSSVKKVREGLGLTGIVDDLTKADLPTTCRIWRFPISRYGNTNANGRIYTKELWEDVIKNQKDTWKNSLGLCDHPEGDSDGSMKDASMVWYDLEIDEENQLIWGLGSFVGIYGHQVAEDIVNHGGKIGFSSSGFGDVLPSGEVVDYVIERPADIVLNPSQAVYGSYADQHEDLTKVENKKETTQMEEKVINESVQTTVKLTESGNALAFASAKDFVKRQLESIANIESPTEKMTAAFKLRAFVKENMEDAESTNAIEEALTKAQNEVEEAVAGMMKIKAMNESESIDEAIKNEEVAKELLEKMTDKTASLRSLNTALVERALNMKEKYKALEAELKSAKEAMKEKDARYLALVDKMANLKESTKNAVSEAEEKVSRVAARKLAELEEAKSLMADSLRKSRKTLTAVREENAQLKGQLESLDGKLKEAAGSVETLAKRNSLLKKEYEAVKADSIALTEAIEEKEKLSGEVTANQIFRDEDSGIFKTMVGANQEVDSYYEGLVNKYGLEKVQPFEDQFKACSSYNEAFTVFMKNRAAIDDKFAKIERHNIDPNIQGEARKSLLRK